MTLVLEARAKVNLLLRVGPPGPDGYHPLGTVFCALELADSVELQTDEVGGPGLDVAYDDPLRERPDLGHPTSNLAVRAAQAFWGRAGLSGGIPRIRLVKRIPPGGGLGGGSSDAAAVLRGLAQAYPGAVEPKALRRVAAKLGADVPFFLLDSPMARATGRGDHVEALAALPSRPVVLVLPGFGVATADAYRWLDRDRGTARVEPPEAPPQLRSWDEVAAVAVNDLEDPVFARHPVLGEIRDRLVDLGASPALMAGSGSTVFGVFDATETADRALARLSGLPGVAAAVRTTTRTSDSG